MKENLHLENVLKLISPIKQNLFIKKNKKSSLEGKILGA